MRTILSSNNDIIKEIKALKLKKHREDKKLFVIEGIRFVKEALQENAVIARIMVSEHLSETRAGEELLIEIEAAGHETYYLPEKLFKEISETETPQGVLAVVNMKSCSLEDIVSKEGFVILLEAIQDPGNLGTIIRTADAAGAAGVILTKGCVDLYNSKVLRSTMGSVFHIPICTTSLTEEALDLLRARGVKSFAAHLQGQTYYFNEDLKGSIAIIIGNEANGITEETASKADKLIKIPMPGKSESLNASVAASVIMYEALRQRITDNKK